MIHNIPKEIFDRFNSILDTDVIEIKPKSQQIYVRDIIERIYFGYLVQFIRLNTYTDGKIIIGENTREIICKGKAALFIRSELFDIPVTYITRFEDRICLFIDTEYLEKTEFWKQCQERIKYLYKRLLEVNDPKSYNYHNFNIPADLNLSDREMEIIQKWRNESFESDAWKYQ